MINIKDKRAYDTNNIFAKIIKGEVSCEKIYEDDLVLAFHDLYPAAKIHILVLPKNHFISFDDFITTSTSYEIEHFFKTVQKIAQSNYLDKTGYRLVMNHGINAMQSIPHFHLHILGDEPLGGMTTKDASHLT